MPGAEPAVVGVATFPGAAKSQGHPLTVNENP